jgi:glycerate kinase
MRILVAPQEFKGSLTAAEAAGAIALGARGALPDAEVEELPLSDGGPGLVDAMLLARGGRRMHPDVHDPLMRQVGASWALLPDRTAVIEMAAASGLVLLEADERDPLVATTYGTGELIRSALDAGCTSIVVGVGGSATVDAGAGAMQALGARLTDGEGRELPKGGAALGGLDRIDVRDVDARLRAVPVRVASDVTNTLCGPTGAAEMFGPQKGASPDDVQTLEAALQHFASVALRDFSINFATVPGSGAAGGLGAGLMIVAGATIEPGFAIVAESVGLTDRIAACDIVVTGEGRLDEQTGYGKTVSGVATAARAQGKPVVVVAGSVMHGADASPMFDIVASATPGGVPVEEAMRNARSLVADAARRAVMELVKGR